ncbi:MAG: DHH family phosphoesterase [Defluviitaleaceae bacterium]|nr:DHH family phosphoesterase [Defluviitaleaceae bacterium]
MDSYIVIRDILCSAQKVVLAGHVNPDADAIGASFGLAMALHKLGKEVFVMLDALPEKYHMIPGAHFLWKNDGELPEADVFVALDCGDLSRIGAGRALFDRVDVTVCIDHHGTNIGFARHNLIDAETSSACEMIYDLIEPIVEIDHDIAAALYAGIVSDTGGFRFNQTTPGTMNKVARLVATGIAYTEIYNELLHYHAFKSLKALGITFNNTRTLMDGRVIYSAVKKCELDAINASYTDLDGVIKHLINTRGVQVAIFAHENNNPGEVKVSFRAHQFDVGNFATRWGGGGHKLAAGCLVTKPIDAFMEEMLDTLIKELQNA